MRNFWLCLLLSAFSAQALAQAGRMLGRVTDGNNNPVPAVTIYIVNESFAQAAITNVTGYFTFLTLPVGKYTVKAIKRGASLWEKQVNVAPATLRLDIDLKESAREVAAKQIKDELKSPVKPKASPTIKTQKSEPAKTSEPAPTEPIEKEAKESQEAETKTLSDDEIAKDEGLSQSVENAKALETTDAAKVDTKPEVVGGMQAINRKIIYPEAARAQGVQGGVIAKVSVDREGNPTKVVVLKSTNQMFSEEVFRVLSEDIKFKPAMLNGKPVASAAVIYVEFKLD